MDIPVILLILRLLSAAALLSFLGLIAWIMFKDMRATEALVSDLRQQQGRLIVIASDSGTPPVGTIFELKPMTSIGRASKNNVVLDDGYTSSEHALLILRANRWWLQDLDSRNGSSLNDLPLEEAAVVSSGDVITIGGTKLKIEL